MATSTWTDELKQEAIRLYQEAEPNEENTVEICRQVAEELDQSPNGVRMILSKAGVYIKKAAPKTATEEDKPKRVSKQDSIDALKEVIRNAGKEVDDSILDKLTGKAAIYLASVIED